MSAYPGTLMPSGRYRVYPLQIVFYDWDGDGAYMSKGHHPAEEFLDALRRFKGEPLVEGYGWTVDKVEHEWWATRQGYGMTGRDGEYRYLTEPVKMGARGAYPVTVVHV